MQVVKNYFRRKHVDNMGKKKKRFHPSHPHKYTRMTGSNLEIVLSKHREKRQVTKVTM